MAEKDNSTAQIEREKWNAFGNVSVIDGVDPEAGEFKIFPSPDLNVGYEGLDQILPYDGLRNTVHRSHWSKTGKLSGRTEDDDNLPRPVGFESSLERSTAISCLIHPNTWGLKCQPLKVIFDKPIDEVKSNTLDFLLTRKDGSKTYMFVRNEDSLGHPRTALICEAIREKLPTGVGFAQISEAAYPAPERGNLERKLIAKRVPDAEADQRLAEVLQDLRNSDCFTVEELVVRCRMGPRLADDGRAFDAVLRAIADRKLAASRFETTDYPTILRWPE
ncbi:hypothetical protein [Pseudophaeobacter sp. TrK17]|uniref:hypothetical protein n=1 Tax=Pseudophaeobacter sp. TrK17 TaxID=2815167 RepID=UPI0035D1184C